MLLLAYSQFGLQGIVLFKNTDKYTRVHKQYLNRYWTPMLLRSSRVFEQSNFYQFAPCGSFSIFEPKETSQSAYVKKSYCDLFLGLMQEYCEELFSDSPASSEPIKFGDSKFDAPIAGIDNRNTLLDSPYYQELIEMIENGLVDLEFLGVSSSLV